MVLNTKVNMLEVKNMEEEDLNGLTAHNLKEILMIIISKEMVNILGLMEENILDNEKQIKWRERMFYMGRW